MNTMKASLRIVLSSLQSFTVISAFTVLAIVLCGAPWYGGSSFAARSNSAAKPADSLVGLLNADGTLKAGAQGSFDASGYRMRYSAGGTPVFVQASGNPDDNWDTQFGANGTVFAIAVSGSDVYVGGIFTTIGGVNANRIAKWNGSSWAALGSGIDSTNASVATVETSGSDVYVGGRFTSAGGASANNIAKWNGSSWSALGSGIDRSVNDIAISGSEVFVGGFFTTAGGASANNIAKWNGSSWSALGSGINSTFGIVNAVAVSGSDLYVGGYSSLAGADAFSVAKWNGSSWVAVGGGTGAGSTVSALAISGSDLYVGGAFNTFGGFITSGIAKWNGSSWSALGSGIANPGSAFSVSTIALKGSDIYVGGTFTLAGGVSTQNIAKWNGTSWSALGSGVDDTVSAIATGETAVYVGGAFNTAGGKTASKFARYSLNNAPAITAASALTRQQGSPAGSAITIATVSDPETAAGSLTVTATTIPAGITISNITNTNGTVSAQVAAGCNATVGANTVVLTVTDGALTTTANLTINVTANTPPALGTYANTAVDTGLSLSVQPHNGPTDNGTIASQTATASAGFTGTLTVNAANGAVTINNAAPVGTHTITVTATDNCGATSTRTFTLTVNSAPPECGNSADYRFQNSLASTGETAPALNNLGNNSFGTATVDGTARNVLRFGNNNGLSLTPTTGVISNQRYTMVLLFSFAELSNYRRILDFSNGTLDHGLYFLNGKLVFFDTALSNSNAPIAANQFVQVVLTRDTDKAVVGYVNGVQQFSFTDTANLAVINSNNVLRFFIDEGPIPGEASAGAIARLRLYDCVLTPTAIAALDRAAGDPVNTAPTIAPAAALTRQQGSAAGSAVTIATVNDAETATGNLVVTATTAPAGLTVTNLTNTNGTIAAQVAASCNAAAGNNTVVLTVSDGTLTATANLTVNVTANTPPALGAYPASSVALNGNVTITPAAAPSDNGSIASVVVTAPGIVPFLGTATVNATTGVVTVTNARPAGSHPLFVTLTDNCGAQTTVNVALMVTCPAINIAPAMLPIGTLGAAYNQTLTASGGATPYTFSLMSGALPNGVTLNGNGTLGGTPTASGRFTFTVKATDANSCTVTRDYTLPVSGCPFITINPATLPNGVIGKPYSQTLTATGGTMPYTFMSLGGLPAGLTLTSNGTLSGTPTVFSAMGVTIKVTDANGCMGTREYQPFFENPFPVLISLTPASATVGSGELELLVAGTDFVPGVSVWWRNQPLSVTFLSPTQLRVIIPASDLATAGTVQITASNPGPNPRNSNALTFTITPNTSARYEGDVWPRGGDGLVNRADVNQMARYALRFNTVPLAEFQRADSAPRASLGNRRITTADVVQVARYAAGLDPLVEAGGPTTPALQDEPNAVAENLAAVQTGSLAVTAGNFTRGQIGTVTIQATALGSESAVSFTLNYDVAKLSFLDAMAASGLPANLSGAEVFVNDSEPGKVAVLLLLPARQTLPVGTTTILNLRFLPNGGAGLTNASFTFGDEIIAREATDAAAETQQPLTTTNGNNTVSGNAPAFASAASYLGGAVAPADSIVAIFGVNLATATATGNTLPLPTTLAGTTVTLTDSANRQFAVPLFFVSSGQINCLIPAGAAMGAATVTIRNSNGETTTGLLRINELNPALFAAAGTGRGLAAALALRVFADGTQRYENVARFDATANQFVAVPIDLSNANEQVFLVLYGTGLRARTDLAEVVATLGGSINGEVLYAGAQGGLAGLDQINVRLPRGLAGRGDVDVTMTVDGKAANAVKVNIK